MIYRNKPQLQNSKQPIRYSPLHSPSSRKKTPTAKQTKLSSKPYNRENKENIQQKQSKTDRANDEKFFKIANTSEKKSKINSKITIQINLNKTKNHPQYTDLNVLNIETPKFKCSSNKIDDRCKTEHIDQNEKYFSFGDNFRENVLASFQHSKMNKEKLQRLQSPKYSFDALKRQSKLEANPLKQQTLMLKQKNKSIQQDSGQKTTIISLKKKDKNEKLKQTQQKLELRFLQLERELKQNRFKQQRDVFCFKK